MTRIALAATVLVLAALAGFGLWGRLSVGPAATHSPEATPSASPRTLTGTDQGVGLAAGTYRTGPPFTVPLQLSVPSGWTVDGYQSDALLLGRPEPPATRLPLRVRLIRPDGVYVDPCHREGGASAVGPTAADLASALAALPGFEASPVADVTLDGKPAKMVTLTHSIDLATADCTDGTVALMTYRLFGAAQDFDVFAEAEELIWVVDVNGTRLLIAGTVFDYSSDEERSEVEDIVSSINFD